MSVGEYSINVPIGTYALTASKPGYIHQRFKIIKVLEDQSSILNFELIGGESMEHIVDVTIANGNEETITVPDGIAAQSYIFIGAISSNPVVDNIIELLSEDGNTVIQTQITNADGRVTFTDIFFGNYKLRIV